MKKIISSLMGGKNNRHLIDEADALRDAGRYAEAADAYTAYLADDPKDYGIWVQRGNCLKDSGQHSLARVAYEAALALRTDDADLYVQMGHLSKLQGKQSEAIRYYKKSLEIDENSMDARFELQSMGTKLSKFSYNSSNRPNDIGHIQVYDISDFLIFLGYHNRVTGIQRVQYFFIKEIFKKGSNVNTYFVGNTAFCYLDSDTHEFRIVNINDLLFLNEIISSNDANRQDINRAINKIKFTSISMEIKDGDAFVFLGAFWINNNYLNIVYKFKEKNVKIGIYIYDLIPISHPSFVEEPNRVAYFNGFKTILPMADFILTISEFVAKEVRGVIELELGYDLPVVPAPLGHELPREVDDQIDVEDIDFLSAVPGEYVLCVCTIEERKNHDLLVEIWSSLYRKHGSNIPSLVIVGRWGWHVDSLRRKLEDINYLNGKIVVLGNLADSQLAHLYKNCLFSAFPSFAEGWGLPVGESLAYGKPCIASNTTAIPEVGGDFCKYINPYDIIGSTAVFDQALNDRQELARWTNRIKKEFTPRTWQETVDHFHRTIDAFCSEARPSRSARSLVSFDNGILYKINYKNILSDDIKWSKRGLQFILRRGWHQIEDWGVWASEASSVVSFFTRAHAREQIRVYLELQLPPPASDANILIKSDGIAKTVNLTSAGSNWVIFDMVTDNDGQAEITVVRQGVAPQVDEARMLFVGLRSLGYHKISDVEGRLNILEGMLGIQ